MGGAPHSGAGPTLARIHFFVHSRAASGALHIVDLPGVEAARRFVEDEPYNRAGLFEHHLVRRFEDLLGRTMWEFPGASDDPRFLVIAQSAPDPPPPERLIFHGELLSPEGGPPLGVAFALQAPTRDAVRALVGDAQVHDWELGGRR